MTFTARTETYVNLSSLTTPYDITVNKPSGTVDGDILFCLICFRSTSTRTIDSVPSGWAELGNQVGSNQDDYALYYKIASGEPASWTWSFNGSVKVRAVCSCYTSGDFDGGGPIDVVSNVAYRTSNNQAIAASMNVSAANSPLIFWAGAYSTSSKNYTKPSVPTSDWVEDDDAGSTTPDFWTTVCSMMWVGSGITGDMIATISASLTQKHAFAVALNPSSSVTNIGVSDGVGLTDVIGKERRLSVYDALGALDELPKTNRDFSVTETLLLVDLLLKRRNVAPISDIGVLTDLVFKQRLLQAIGDSVILTEGIYRDRPILIVSDGALLIDGATLLRNLSILDSVSFLDEVDIDYGATQVLVSDVLQIVDEIYKTRETTIGDTLLLYDLPSKGRNISPILDSLNLSDLSYIDKPLVLVLETLVSMDSVLTDKNITVNEQIALIDNILTKALGEGWMGKISGVHNPAKVAAILREKIKDIMNID